MKLEELMRDLNINEKVEVHQEDQTVLDEFISKLENVRIEK